MSECTAGMQLVLVNDGLEADAHAQGQREHTVPHVIWHMEHTHTLSFQSLPACATEVSSVAVIIYVCIQEERAHRVSILVSLWNITDKTFDSANEEWNDEKKKRRRDKGERIEQRWLRGSIVHSEKEIIRTHTSEKGRIKSNCKRKN